MPTTSINRQETHDFLDDNFVIYNTRALRKRLLSKLPLPNKRIGELLMSFGLVNQDQLDQALSYQSHHPDQPLGKILINMHLVDEEIFYKALALKLGLAYAHLSDFDIDLTALEYLTYEQALKHRLLPLMNHQGRLIIATSNPTDYDLARIAEFITGQHIDFVVASPNDLADSIDKHYGKQQEAEDISQLESSHTSSYLDAEDNNTLEIERLSKERPIVRLVQHMLTEAVRKKASDIHVRPGEKEVELIYRIDGTLIPIKTFDRHILPAVVSRIKILANMDISERRVAQDGRAKITLNSKAVDLRISVMPTINGESVVIRLLDTTGGMAKLDDLGFEEKDRVQLNDILNKSYGILLVTGPTGSGKSTTLYSALNKIREKNVNIITVENPVEYHISGIEQMQVNEKVGYTFARILRNILRHDPDVIMVGEIRDQETAKIAIESALTGHFVLSTLHTNSAATTVSRLLEMGIEPYLITDTLLGVLAQRLVRKNCPHCLSKEAIDPHIYEVLEISTEEKFYRGQGCEDCNQTGYKGRHAVYELLTSTPKMHTLINQQANAEKIHHQALEDGMTPLTENALNLARRKITSLAEVYRVRLT